MCHADVVGLVSNHFCFVPPCRMQYLTPKKNDVINFLFFPRDKNNRAEDCQPLNDRKSYGVSAIDDLELVGNGA